MSLTKGKCYRCGCFLRKNYHVPELGVHVSFSDEETFLKDNAKILSNVSTGCKEKILNDIKEEYLRRAKVESASRNRKHVIQRMYTPLLKDIYVLKEEYLDQKFIELVQTAKAPDATISSVMSLLTTERASEVYRFSVFTKDFCNRFLRELDHFTESDLPRGRPNTMNKYGILLEELGFYDNFISPLREDYLNAIALILYPAEVDHCLDSHKSFTVKYSEGEDLDLAFHYDNAEVTLNVCLGKEFEDGSLYFGRMRKDLEHLVPIEVKHVVGEGVLHRGQHMHGAMPISNGERVNLIIWMRSSTVRNKCCPMCDRQPNIVPADGFGDGFTAEAFETVQMCQLH